MAVGDVQVIDSINTSTGETLVLMREQVANSLAPEGSSWGIYELNLELGDQKYLVSELREVPSGALDTMFFTHYVRGQLFEAGGRYSYIHDTDGISSDAIILSTYSYSYDNYIPYLEGDVGYEDLNERSVIWDPEHGIIGDDEWRGVTVSGTYSESGMAGLGGGPSVERFYVTRLIDDQMVNIYLWDENTVVTDADHTLQPGYKFQDMNYREIDQRQLANGEFLAGTIFSTNQYKPFVDWSGKPIQLEIRVDLVDAEGGIQHLGKTTRPVDIYSRDYYSGHIVEAEDSATSYIASYKPLDGLYSGADGYQTDFFVLTDDGIKYATLDGPDVMADDVTGIQLSDDDRTATISYTDADGISRSSVFYADWNTGLLTAAPSAQISGTPGDDILIRWEFAEKIWGLAGDDYIDGRGGSDTIFGGDGADIFVLNPDYAADKIKDFSTAESDQLDASALADTGIRVVEVDCLYSGKGALLGLGVTDLETGKLLVELRGTQSAVDVATNGFTGVYGEDGQREIWVGAKMDNDGTAELHGTAGADIITTEAGQGIYAAAGADVILVEESAQIWGGMGEDLFIFGDTGGRIRDFDAGVDVIDLSDWGVQSLDDLTMAVRLTGKGAVTDDLLISDGDHVIRLDGTLASELGADDFLFA